MTLWKVSELIFWAHADTVTGTTGSTGSRPPCQNAAQHGRGYRLARVMSNTSEFDSYFTWLLVSFWQSQHCMMSTIFSTLTLSIILHFMSFMVHFMKVHNFWITAIDGYWRFSSVSMRHASCQCTYTAPRRGPCLMMMLTACRPFIVCAAYYESCILCQLWLCLRNTLDFHEGKRKEEVFPKLRTICYWCIIM